MPLLISFPFVSYNTVVCYVNKFACRCFKVFAFITKADNTYPSDGLSVIFNHTVICTGVVIGGNPAL